MIIVVTWPGLLYFVAGVLCAHVLWRSAPWAWGLARTALARRSARIKAAT